MMRVIVVLLIALSANVAVAFDCDDSQLKKALTVAKKGKWKEAESCIKKSKNPNDNQILLNLLKLQQGKMSVVEAQKNLRKKEWLPRGFFVRDIKSNLNSHNKPSELISWFKQYAPKTNYQKLLYMDAQVRAGKINLAVEKNKFRLRQLWRNMITNSSEEKSLYKRYRKYFSVYDIKVKMSEALWRDRATLANFFLNKLSHRVENRALYEARINIARSPARYKHLMHNKKFVKYKNDDFITYTHIRYLLKRNHDSTALSLLKNYKPSSHYIKWWKIKHIAARNAMRQKRYTDAYNLLLQHKLPNGSDYSDAEWLAGWLKYRFMKQPSDAIKHFYRVYTHAKFANSKSKGAYWLGRVFADLNNEDKKVKWYNIAAKYKGCFYGQLALHDIKQLKSTQYIKEQNNSAVKTKIIPVVATERELAVLYYKTGHPMMAQRFVRQILSHNLSSGQLKDVMEYFYRHKTYPLAVTMAKDTANKGKPLMAKGYPSDVKIKNGRHKSLYLSLIRQESNFDQHARSPVGAVGLMQLMPRTAHKLAKQLKLPRNAYRYSADANVAKGSKYVDDLYNRFGSHILTIASYNAGPHRSARWIKRYGNPKNIKTVHDTVDWIEQIPYGETRFYVKKVLENLTIYEYLLNSSSKKQKTLVDYLDM